MTQSGSNGSGPWWAKLIAYVGAPMLLLAGVLGMIPGLRSPVFEIQQSLAAHRVETRRLTDVFALICRGTWRGMPDRQADCDTAARGLIRDSQETP